MTEPYGCFYCAEPATRLTEQMFVDSRLRSHRFTRHTCNEHEVRAIEDSHAWMDLRVLEDAVG